MFGQLFMPPGYGGGGGGIGMGIPGQYQMGPVSLLPQTNLPQNLPLVQNLPLQNFSIKDQHLLKPPTVMGVGKY